MNSIAIITARGGSKRIPRKNIKNFLGRPIIEYVIDSAIACGCFREIIVSTDDEKIALVAKNCGASIPFFRSKKTSDDHATIADVLFEVLNENTIKGENFEYFCCLLPTAPFITSKRLQHAYNLLVNSDADTVMPVTQFSYPILRSLTIKENKLQYNWPEYRNTRSQDLHPNYHDSGQFYMGRTSRFLENTQLLTNNTLPLQIPETEAHDIDSEDDWKMAEIKYTLMMKSNEQL